MTDEKRKGDMNLEELLSQALGRFEEEFVEFLRYITPVIEKSNWVWSLSEGVFCVKKINDIKGVIIDKDNARCLDCRPFSKSLTRIAEAARKEALEEVVRKIEWMKFSSVEGGSKELHAYNQALADLKSSFLKELERL